jgi:hypothetical protein
MYPAAYDCTLYVFFFGYSPAWGGGGGDRYVMEKENTKKGEGEQNGDRTDKLKVEVI